MNTIKETWRKFCYKSVINNPNEIYLFLTHLINDTNGHLNVDFIDNGYADQLIKVEHKPPFFFLYWKDFSKIFDLIENGNKVDENEKMDIFLWGGNCFVYQLLAIKDLHIFEIDKNHPVVAINSIYISEKDILKELNASFQVGKNSIKKNLFEFSTYQEFVFQDSQARNHSCQYIQLPNFNLLIQDKVKPIENSETVMEILNRKIFEDKISLWKKELVNYKDFVDEELLMKMCFEIRLYSEKIFKYFLTILIKFNTFDSSDHEYNLESARKAYQELLDKYPYEQMGKLKKKLKRIGTEIDIPERFIINMNEFCHETGSIPKTNDVNMLINEFETLKDQVFSYRK
ncbi:hypothetical protein [Enterococcus sp. LJL90]